MMRQSKNEKRNVGTDRYLARRAAKAATARKEKTFFGRIRKEAKQCAAMVVDVVDLEKNPENPWDDNDWMVM